MLKIQTIQIMFSKHINKKMNSAFAKVSNLKLNRLSKIALTLTSSTFFLYALGQAPIFKNILAGAFSCPG